MNRLAVEDVDLGYGDEPVVEGLSFAVPDGLITAIVGPNACGKSTLLRALSRLLKPSRGSVLLDGDQIHRLPTKQVARTLALLPQSPLSPEGILVSDLVARGRTPHQRLFQQWSAADEAAVQRALTATTTAELADRPVEELSGGQRQRVWIAMALAQDTDLLLLDEPTTFLDISHQIDVLDLVERLNREEGRTVVVVLHDLNLACRYAQHLVAMRSGEVVATGTPDEVITAETVQSIFGLECVVVPDPVSGTPLVVPVGARGRNGQRPDDVGAEISDRAAATPLQE